MGKVRLDKWLWAVRIFKTRALAAEACKKGRIYVNGLVAKASKEISVGDSVTVRKMPVIYTFIIKQTLENRLPARKVPEYLEDITSVEELDKLKIRETLFSSREKGAGRPTKKDRRRLDGLIDNIK